MTTEWNPFLGYRISSLRRRRRRRRRGMPGKDTEERHHLKARRKALIETEPALILNFQSPEL
jgi:hypothetical protein